MPSNHLILCPPLLLLPPIPPRIGVFSNELTLRMRWPKYWSFSFNISPSNEHPGLISFRMDWLDLLAVQGTLKSLLHSSKESILRHSAFFIVQLSHPYMTTGKTIGLTRRTFVSKVTSLLFNMLSRLVIKCSYCKLGCTLGINPGGEHGNALQYSCPQNPIDRGAWWAIVHGVIKSWTRLKWLSMHISYKMCIGFWKLSMKEKCKMSQ